MNRMIAVLLIATLSLTSGGCATILRGTSQSVTVKTLPAGRSVFYQGRELADGEIVAIQKQFEPPRFYVGDLPVDMRHDPDPLLIGDAALLLFFVVPGLVALGIDFATGAWRDLHEMQVIPVPDSVARSGTSGTSASRAGDDGEESAESTESAGAEAEPRASEQPSSTDAGAETSSVPSATNGVVGATFQDVETDEPGANAADTGAAGDAQTPAETGDPTAFSSPEREGTMALRGSLGFTLDPDTLLLASEGNYFATENVAIGPLLQLGFSGNRLIVAPTFNVRGVFDLPGDELERLKPFFQGGVGFAYLYRDNRRGDDDDVGFLLNLGFGADYHVSDEFSVGSNMLFNILPDDVIGENFFFSSQFLSASFYS